MKWYQGNFRQLFSLCQKSKIVNGKWKIEKVESIFSQDLGQPTLIRCTQYTIYFQNAMYTSEIFNDLTKLEKTSRKLQKAQKNRVQISSFFLYISSTIGILCNSFQNCSLLSFRR